MIDVVNIVKDTGVTIAIVGFFMYRDLKFNTQLNQTLQALVDAINTLKAEIMRGHSKDEQN